MKRIFTVLGLMLLGCVGYAQQDPQVSQFMFNKLAVNPAYAGASEAICGTLIYRDQWDKFPGSPKTAILSVDAPVPVLHGGVGLNVANDIIGNEKTLIADLSYAYRMNINGNGNLAIGIKAGLFQKQFVAKFNPLELNDPSVPTPGNSAMVPDFAAGLYYNTKDLYCGFSITHIAAPSLKYGTDISQIKLALARHYYFTAGYNYYIDPKFTLKPSVLIKTDPTQPQMDLNLTLLYNNLMWGGVSYRWKDAVVAMVGIEYNNFKLGYAFDITTSNIRPYSSGTHEVMVGYCYKPVKITNFKMHKNVRFL